MGAIWRVNLAQFGANLAGFIANLKCDFGCETRRIYCESRRSYKLDSVIDSRVVGANLNGDYLSNKRILQRALSEWLKS